jgi:hypothetical protein
MEARSYNAACVQVRANSKQTLPVRVDFGLAGGKDRFCGVLQELICLRHGILYRASNGAPIHTLATASSSSTHSTALVPESDHPDRWCGCNMWTCALLFSVTIP